MADARYSIEVVEGVNATIKISLSMTPTQRAIANSKGMGTQEIENVLGQTLQKIIDDLALGESGGIGG